MNLIINMYYISTTCSRCYFDLVVLRAIVTKFGNRVICRQARDITVDSCSDFLTSDKCLIVAALQGLWVLNILLVYDEILLLHYLIHWNRDAAFPNCFENCNNTIFC